MGCAHERRDGTGGSSSASVAAAAATRSAFAFAAAARAIASSASLAASCCALCASSRAMRARFSRSRAALDATVAAMMHVFSTPDRSVDPPHTGPWDADGTIDLSAAPGTMLIPLSFLSEGVLSGFGAAVGLASGMASPAVDGMAFRSFAHSPTLLAAR